MKIMKLRKVFMAILFSAGLITGCKTVAENAGDTNVQNDKEVSVISTTVSAIGVLDKLDAKLIGIPITNMEIPDKYKNLPQIGQSLNPDLEIVTSLSPDLVIVDDMFKNKMEENLKAYDLNTFYFKTNTYNSFIESISSLGKEINKEKEATDLINQLKQVEKDINKKKGSKEPTVAIMFGSGENFMLATENSYLGDLVKTVGGKNITSNLNINSDGFGYAQFSLEQLLKQNPDYILRFAHGDIKNTKAMFDQMFDQNPAYKELDAVKNNKVFDLDSSIFNVSANLGVTRAIKTLGDILYGE